MDKALEVGHASQQDDASLLAFLEERRQEIVDLMSQACKRSGRDLAEVGLVAVSKTVDAHMVELAYGAGYRAFAENRPQELRRKVEALSEVPGLDGLTFDMIGNLQTNKVNQVICNARLSHSVSSEHLAQAISKRSAERGLDSRILLEVNVSGEATKSGFTPAEALECADRVASLPGVSVEGLMTMAPASDPDAARRAFSGLRDLRDALKEATGLPLRELSCGMSGDFGIAIEEGSTLIRLGRVVFDQSFDIEL